MSSRSAPPVLRSAWSAFGLAVIAMAAAAFYLPALEATGGTWPAPLDDTYIYYGFARSTALGHPLAYTPDGGYASGATSAIYPLLLAPLWALGLRGPHLGIGAAAIAVACLFDLARSLAAVARQPWARWLAAPLVVAIPLLDWSWFSGMEVALAGALIGRSLAAAARALEAPAHTRASYQRRAGAWLALLVLARPETLAFAFPLAVAIAHGGRSLSAIGSLARSLGPPLAALAAQACLNRALTGEWSPAGAIRKLLWSDPHASAASNVVAAAINLAVLAHQAVLRAVGGLPGAAALALLLVAAIRARPRLALALLSGAAGTLLAVCQNSTARFQNYRYAAPVLVLLLCAALLGLDALTRRRRIAASLAASLAPSLVAALAAATLLVAPFSQLGLQIDHFARASKNIVEQHGAIARRLQGSRYRRVLVGDAGAIPYLAEMSAIDGLGLGGFRAMPFARASVHGLPAVVELIERLPPAERPDVMALYPSWWGGVADMFGTPIAEARIADNVICAADTKVLYEANWSLLEPNSGGALDELDVADLIDEREHAYRAPPSWVIAATLREGDTAIWDAGRILDPGSAESFAIAAHVPEGPATLALRTDADGPAGSGPDLLVEIERDGRSLARIEARLPPRAPERWNRLTVELPSVAGDDRIHIRALGRSWRSFHTRLLR